MKTKDISISVIVLALLAVVGYFLFSPSGLQPVPNISLKTLSGKTVHLSDLRGHPVLINFWATTCPGCIEEMPQLVDLYNKYSEQGLKMIGVAMSYDAPDQVYNLTKARKIPYTIALDTNGEAARAFHNVSLTPTSFIINPDGKIVEQRIGSLNFPKVDKLIESMLKVQR